MKIVKYVAGLLIGACLVEGAKRLANPYQPLVKNLFPAPKNGCNAQFPNIVASCFNQTALETSIHANSQFINHRYSKYELPPVMIATMMDNQPAIDLLHREGADLNAVDFRQFTSLDHAAIKGNIQAVSQLLSLGVDPSHQNSLGGTYIDYLRYNAPFRSNSDFSLETSPLTKLLSQKHQMDPECLRGAKFVHENVASPSALFEIWKGIKENKQNLPGLKKFIEYQLRQYGKFKENPTTLEVRPRNGNIDFCGLFAVKAIKRGEVIGEYVGEVLDQDTLNFRSNFDEEYLQRDPPGVDAQEYRGMTAAANDAFPNAMFTSILGGVEGLYNRKLILALDDIEPGEEITVDYGATYIRLKQSKQHQELRMDALLNFFSKKNAFKNLLKEFRALTDFFLQPGITEQRRLFLQACMTRMSYVIGTRNTLVTLANHGLFTEKDYVLIQEARNENPSAWNYFPRFNETLERAKNAAQKYAKEAKKKTEL